MKLKNLVLVAISLISIHSFADSAPNESSSVQLKHSLTSANPIVSTLSKNIYKTETYQAEYTVQVPYETTETYTVDVPYQTTETYTEQVPFHQPQHDTGYS